MDVSDKPLIDVVLATGQMSLHHVLLAHNSEPNRARHDRVGFAVRYIGGHVRQTKAARDTATLVRGRNALNTFDLEQAPAVRSTPTTSPATRRIVAGVPASAEARRLSGVRSRPTSSATAADDRKSNVVHGTGNSLAAQARQKEGAGEVARSPGRRPGPS